MFMSMCRCEAILTHLLPSGTLPRAHLRCEALATTAAHETVSAEVGDLERRHLTCDLVELAGKEDRRPQKLEGGPKCDREEERVVGC